MLGNSSSSIVTIAGAGPSGLLLAREMAERGLTVRVVAPAPDDPWTASYGSWERSLKGTRLGHSTSVLERFARAQVVGAAGVPQFLDEPYLRFSTPKLQAELLEAAASRGVEIHAGRVDPQQLPAGLIVDATGRGLWRPDFKACTYQSAYGVWLGINQARSAGLKVESEDIGLMDYRAVGRHSGPPSFLYSMTEGDRVFVQETVLVSRQPMDFERLRQRLVERLRAQGMRRVEATLERAPVEKCLIPLGRRFRINHPRVIPFGAAAGLVQPASGYQLARAAQLAPGLARVLVDALAVSPQAAVAAGADDLWPRERRAAWDLYRWGASTLARMNAAEMGAFVDGFFRLPKAVWLSFMEGEQSPSEIMQTMWGVFSGTPELRWSLLTKSSASTNPSVLGAVIEGSAQNLRELRT